MTRLFWVKPLNELLLAVMISCLAASGSFSLSQTEITVSSSLQTKHQAPSRSFKGRPSAALSDSVDNLALALSPGVKPSLSNCSQEAFRPHIASLGNDLPFSSKEATAPTLLNPRRS